MKNIFLVLVLALVGNGVFAIGGEIDAIAAGLKAGNSKAVSKYFGSTVDLSILDKDDVYSKAQAEIILKDFFAKHPAKSFKILHQGTSKMKLEYAIGNLQTSKGTFRVTYNLRKSGDRLILKQLRIDKQ